MTEVTAFTCAGTIDAAGNVFMGVDVTGADDGATSMSPAPQDAELWPDDPPVEDPSRKGNLAQALAAADPEFAAALRSADAMNHQLAARGALRQIAPQDIARIVIKRSASSPRLHLDVYTKDRPERWKESYMPPSPLVAALLVEALLVGAPIPRNYTRM